MTNEMVLAMGLIVAFLFIVVLAFLGQRTAKEVEHLRSWCCDVNRQLNKALRTQESMLAVQTDQLIRESQGLDGVMSVSEAEVELAKQKEDLERRGMI